MPGGVYERDQVGKLGGTQREEADMPKKTEQVLISLPVVLSGESTDGGNTFDVVASVREQSGAVVKRIVLAEKKAPADGKKGK